MIANRRKSTPGKTLMGFVVIVAIVTVGNVRDFLSRESDEESYYPTALGDGDFFTAAEGAGEGAPLLKFEGVPLLLKSPARVEKKDWAMHKAGRDDTDRFFVYRETESSAVGAPFVGENFYLKVGQGEGAESPYLAAEKPRAVGEE